MNPVTENENIFGLEFGYKYQSSNFSANVNFYRTAWNNRTDTETIDENEEAFGILFPTGGFINTTDLNQLHSGFELDFRYRVNDDFSLKGYASIGSWKYDGDATVEVYEDNLDRDLVYSEPGILIDGIKVGGAAQTSFGLGADYSITDDFRLDLDWNFYDNLYSDLGASTDELLLPSFSLLDLGLSYNLDLNNGKNIIFRANVYNLLGEEYISKSTGSAAASTNEDENWNGVNISNRVAFGKTRTWNVSAKYNF